MFFRQVTIKLPARENEILEKVCRETSRTKTDIIRTLIRSLQSYTLAENTLNMYTSSISKNEDI